MKRTIIILSSTIATVMALIIGFNNWNNTTIDEAKSLESKIVTLEILNKEDVTNDDIPDLYYGVDTRFAAITKSDIQKATSIYDFLNEGEKQQIEHINSVKLVIIKDNQQSNIQAFGDSDQLTEAQLNILKSTDYFSHFTIRTEFKEKNKDTGKLEERFFGPHITVVPDQQATYVDGKEALITYLKDNSKAAMQVIKGDKLGAIKISFIVNKQGIVTNVKHDAMTTQYPSIDEKFMQLVKDIPGEWIPAKNSKGETMDYEFVFTFGPRDGC